MNPSYTKDHKTGYMFDPWSHLGPKRRRLLQESWAGLFRDHILCALPVHELSPSFCADFGRPTKELFAVLGVLILQQMKDLSDEETMVQLAFNEQWHYALDITDASDDATYMSPKTLWNMRKIVTDRGLDTVLFEKIAGYGRTRQERGAPFRIHLFRHRRGNLLPSRAYTYKDKA